MGAYKCDVCGALFERKCTPDVRVNVYTHGYGDEWLDLCPQCQKKLEEFVHADRSKDFAAVFGLERK